MLKNIKVNIIIRGTSKRHEDKYRILVPSSLQIKLVRNLPRPSLNWIFKSFHKLPRLLAANFVQLNLDTDYGTVLFSGILTSTDLLHVVTHIFPPKLQTLKVKPTHHNLCPKSVNSNRTLKGISPLHLPNTCQVLGNSINHKRFLFISLNIFIRD